MTMDEIVENLPDLSLNRPTHLQTMQPKAAEKENIRRPTKKRMLLTNNVMPLEQKYFQTCLTRKSLSSM